MGKVSSHPWYDSIVKAPIFEKVKNAIINNEEIWNKESFSYIYILQNTRIVWFATKGKKEQIWLVSYATIP